MSLLFPTSPNVGDTYRADNGVVYTWTGDRWSAAQTVQNLGQTIPVAYGSQIVNNGYSLNVDTGGTVTLPISTQSAIKIESGDITLRAGFHTWIADSLQPGVYSKAVALDSQGNTIIIGVDDQGNQPGYMIKLNTRGNVIWRQDIAANIATSSTAWWEGYGLCVDNSDNIYSTINYQYGTNLDNSPNREIELIKFDTNGNIIWNTSFGFYGTDLGFSLAYDGSTGIVLAGQTQALDTSSYDIFVAKFDQSSGTATWQTIVGNIGSAENEYGMAVNTSTGKILVVGSSDTVMNGSNTSSAMIVVQLDGVTGTVDWQNSYASSLTNYSYATDAAAEPGGGWYVYGVHNVANYNAAVSTMRLDSSGNIVWSYYYDEGCNNISAAIDTDEQGNLYVNYFTFTEINNNYYFGIGFGKYTPDGTFIWQRYLTNTSTSVLSVGDLWFSSPDTWTDRLGQTLAVRNGRLAMTGVTFDNYSGNNPKAFVLNTEVNGELIDTGNYRTLTSNFIPTPDTYIVTASNYTVTNVTGGNGPLYDGTDNSIVTTSTTITLNTYTDYTTWKFEHSGGLEFPDKTVQTTAYPGQNRVWRSPSPSEWSITEWDSGGVFNYDGTTPIIWFDPRNCPATTDTYLFRGAIISYHAYILGSGTWIGTIHLACDYPTVNWSATHAENANINGVNVNEPTYQFWVTDANYPYALTFGNTVAAQTATTYIQWTAKMFYGNDYNY